MQFIVEIICFAKTAVQIFWSTFTLVRLYKVFNVALMTKLPEHRSKLTLLNIIGGNRFTSQIKVIAVCSMRLRLITYTN